MSKSKYLLRQAVTKFAGKNASLDVYANELQSGMQRCKLHALRSKLDAVALEEYLKLCGFLFITVEMFKPWKHSHNSHIRSCTVYAQIGPKTQIVDVPAKDVECKGDERIIGAKQPLARVTTTLARAMLRDVRAAIAGVEAAHGIRLTFGPVSAGYKECSAICNFRPGPKSRTKVAAKVEVAPEAQQIIDDCAKVQIHGTSLDFSDTGDGVPLGHTIREQVKRLRELGYSVVSKKDGAYWNLRKSDQATLMLTLQADDGGWFASIVQA